MSLRLFKFIEYTLKRLIVLYVNLKNKIFKNLQERKRDEREERKRREFWFYHLENIKLWALPLTLLCTPFQKANTWYILSRKIKIDHPHSQAKNGEQKLGIWQEGKGSKTGNWLGQTCGKSRQPTMPLMKVPIIWPCLCTPPAVPTLSSWEDLFQRSSASAFQGKHGWSTFYHAMLQRRHRWHAGSSSSGWREGANRSQCPWSWSKETKPHWTEISAPKPKKGKHS